MPLLDNDEMSQGAQSQAVDQTLWQKSTADATTRYLQQSGDDDDDGNDMEVDEERKAPFSKKTGNN